MYSWDTVEGGPCLLRPTSLMAPDGPDTEHYSLNCVEGYDRDWRPVMKSTKHCEPVWADEDSILHDSKYQEPYDDVEGPYNSSDPSEKQTRHNIGWNNQFAFPWEIGAYWNLTTR